MPGDDAYERQYTQWAEAEENSRKWIQKHWDEKFGTMTLEEKVAFLLQEFINDKKYK